MKILGIEKPGSLKVTSIAEWHNFIHLTKEEG